MFTGIIEDIGITREAKRQSNNILFTIETHLPLNTLTIGDSIAINGACLTIIKKGSYSFSVESTPETCEKTTLGLLQPGHRVNLERALSLNDRIGGHILLGHVDGISKVSNIEGQGNSWRIGFRPPMPLMKYMAKKGSIGIDGISLTISELKKDEIYIHIIPHTLISTTLSERRPGDTVNVECDVISMYIERHIEVYRSKGMGKDITLDLLKETGFV